MYEAACPIVARIVVSAVRLINVVSGTVPGPSVGLEGWKDDTVAIPERLCVAVAARPVPVRVA